MKAALRAFGFEPKKEEIQKIILDVHHDGTGTIRVKNFSNEDP